MVLEMRKNYIDVVPKSNLSHIMWSSGALEMREDHINVVLEDSGSQRLIGEIGQARPQHQAMSGKTP